MAQGTAFVVAIAVTGSFGSVGHAEDTAPAPAQGPPPVSSTPPPLTPAPDSPAPEPPFSYQPAQLDAEPSSGTGAIIVGWLLLGSGAVALGMGIPLCYYFPDFREISEAERADDKRNCAGAFGVLAGLELGIGIPVLISGYSKRSNHKAWERRNVGVQALLGTRVLVRDGGAFLSYSASF